MCATCGCGQPDPVSGHSHHQRHDTLRLLKIEQDLLAKNDRYATSNRNWLNERAILVLNLVSSPGAGKTSLLVQTLKDLKSEIPFAVIEGDQQTSRDTDRIRGCGVPAIQINTGKGCHLDAHQIGHALRDLEPVSGSVVMIENVGNLVCPAAFDLGEDGKVVVLSVTEGDDKPIKYPNMFHEARLMIISKIDLLPHVDFDVAQCIEYARRINQKLEVIQLSVKTGVGLESWYRWLRREHELKVGTPAEVS